MARSGRFIGLFAGILMFVHMGPLFSQELWSEVSMDKTSVYLGEPMQVKLSVYTSTWFTRGIDLGNIKVNGAFTVYFRPVSTSVRKDGQTYSGVQLIYNVFPYSEKDLVFPSLDITVETPPEGGYKGERRVIKSPEKQIRVNPIPAGFNQDRWLVTTHLSLSDTWQGDLNNVKVGDVLERRISRVAQGTVSELIPPVHWDSVPGAGLYSARSTVENNKSRTAISATRNETMRFLFEEEGQVTIPEMVFTWYDPIRKQLFKRTLKKITVHVQPNPDLGVLASVRDSLRMDEAEAMQEFNEEKSMKIMGLSPGQFAVVVSLAVILAYLILILTRRLLRLRKSRQEQYRNSEAYYFRKFKNDAGSKDLKIILQALYRWIDQLKIREPSITFFATKYGTRELQEEVKMILEGVNTHSPGLNIHISEWQKARKNYHKAQIDKTGVRLTTWINPVRYRI